VTNTINGISLRNQWLSEWDFLRLDEFSVFEIVPFTESGNSESWYSSQFLKKLQGKCVWMHLTSTSVCDDPDFFMQRVDRLKPILAEDGIAGISVHLGCEFMEGRMLAGPSMPIFSKMQIENMEKNISVLRKVSRTSRIAIENLSTTCGEDELSDYLFRLTALSSQFETEILLDLSNLENSCLNADFDIIKATRIVDLSRLAYFHVGGAIKFGDVYYDSHDKCPKPSVRCIFDLLCRAGTSTVFEYDFEPWRIDEVSKILKEVRSW
jgi:uncharacterized protein (UPF0276 family)